ncbi:type II secretion system F family protein [Roseobacter ponti]|uniref:Type II secretion system F family protein n=1 Tax=Roseobacter ponti TaxID=1891787 RepID=A0A858SVX5_9RHOB|nr:type II secretion system F family protein [Roseobacter ponti]QJF51803.1 type II secretion system F family protein [Roseobacter ponti]
MLIDLSFLGIEPFSVNPYFLADMMSGETLNVQMMMYVGIFVGVLTTFEGMRQLMSRGENRTEAKSRRMQMMDAGKSTEEILAILKPQAKRGILGRLPIVGDLPTALTKAGMTISPSLFVMCCLTGVLVFGATISMVFGPLIGVTVGVVLFGVFPLLLVKSACQKRMEHFVRQLPDALELMARGLRVGHPLNTTIRSVANEMSDPVASEFGIVMDQIAYGDDLPDAFAEMADRIDLEDVRYLSVSIGIQHGSGGDLAAILATLSRVIRNRLSMRRRIKAISSEGRMSAYILSVIPVAIFLFTSIGSPDYYGGVMDEPLFVPVAITVVLLVVANAVALHKLVNFRI